MSELLLEYRGELACLTLNRPELHNAFNEYLISELTVTLAALATDTRARVVLLTGAGKSFCAGADLSWMERMSRYSHDENLADAAALQTLLHLLYTFPKPTIAAVNGAAMGGGAGLVAACDYALASERATFAFSEVKLGLIPAVISPYVVEKLGPGTARAFCTTGRRFDAATALRIGLVHELVAPEHLLSAAEGFAQTLLANGPEAVAKTKALLHAIQNQPPEAVAAQTVAAIAEARASEEGQEGIRAFLEKRTPRWH